MSTPQRRAFAAKNPVEVTHQALDKAWSNATKAAWEGAEGVIDDAGYAVSHPIESLQAIGDFAEDAARAAWDEVEKTYGNGQMAWNEVTKVLSADCNEKWTVLLETALPAAGAALYLFIIPSPREILENYLEPYPSKKGRRGNRRSDAKDRRRSKSGRKRRHFGGIPDVDSLIANMLPGRDWGAGAGDSTGKQWLFKGINISDRVLWYWLVADAFNRFTTVWTSGMREARFCENSWDHLFVASAYNDSNLGIETDDWTAIDASEGVSVGSTTVTLKDDSGDRVTATDGEALLTLGATNDADPGKNWDVLVKLEATDPDTGQTLAHDEKELRLDGGESGEVSLSVPMADASRASLGVELLDGGNRAGSSYKSISVFAKS